jgi:hypothetical protein
MDQRNPSALDEIMGGLEKLTDDDLRTVGKRTGALLESREKERRAEALREIQKIAKAHGLNVDVKEGAQRKRGRPAKTAAGG